MADDVETGERPRNVKGRVPAPKIARRRRSALSRVFYPLFITLALTGLIAAGVLAYGYSLYEAEGPLQQAKVFEVKKGLQTPEIASGLEDAGIITSANVFTAAALLTGKRGSLKAGEYEFPAEGSIRDVMNIIVGGKAILYKLSVPEGFTTEQALTRVREHEVLTGALTLAPAEGALMPDTYVFRRGKTRNDVVQDMIDAQVKLKEELWSTRKPDVPVKTPEEAVVLASIVEKETGVAEERPRVAAVFANRLRKGMRLQSDPTIIYGITLGKTKLDRPLRRSDIAQTTPYNTYRISGLPPGPIANPGRAALEAVLNPIDSKDLYFVADGTGGHAFAETLEQHNANVAKWRKLQQADDAPVQDDGTETAAAPAPAPDVTAAAPAPAPVEQDVAASQTPENLTPAAEPIPEELPPMPAPKPSTATAAPEPEAAVAGAEPKKLASTEEPAAVAKKPEAEPAVAEDPAEAAAAADPKPGSVLKVANRLVPIPVPKPQGQ